MLELFFFSKFFPHFTPKLPNQVATNVSIAVSSNQTTLSPEICHFVSDCPRSLGTASFISVCSRLSRPASAVWGPCQRWPEAAWEPPGPPPLCSVPGLVHGCPPCTQVLSLAFQRLLSRDPTGEIADPKKAWGLMKCSVLSAFLTLQFPDQSQLLF